MIYNLYLIAHAIVRGDYTMNERIKQSQQKSATDNQWVSTGIVRPVDKSERRDGPGGEDADKSKDK